MTAAAFEALFDDAAIFPPGNAPVDVAVKDHLAREATPDGARVGPLVCDVGRLPALLDAAVRPVRVSVVGSVEELAPALRRLMGSPVEPVGAELRGPISLLPDLPVHSIAVEMPWGTGFHVPPGALLKLRCGGDQVPTVDELAAAIVHCVEHGLQFKLTAGLHSALAHDGAHGFVNVMAAVVAATRGQDPAPVLTAAAEDLDLESLGESRRLFRSIGTCSIDEPLADLRTLGLLE
ncbi:hypothetical protein [Aeromicrobium choanae]|uniref:Uncharacterized protein n=1 Tax=Aeromicrobium choanae TaxID=1736691 RepID=A0A1T4YPV5_9ACTN|nr:hypothetical protein [Aeromicrobium choanae]SKB03301.1 hypothetical protein SAMN06295964_0217 [Aeromicrobium choanae]